MGGLAMRWSGRLLSVAPAARRSLGFLTAVLVGLLGAGLAAVPAVAQQPAPVPQSLSEFVRVKEDVYAFRYQNHVSMLIPTDEGAIVVDPIGQSNRQAPA
ncbi:MAG: hypothetical protein M3442_05920, partial [Chloroflexota bacterium]|nr:hypothetical protein [Chloroflexota bacterium]